MDGEKREGKFYLVKRAGHRSYASSFEHQTGEEAAKEARRLAEETPGCLYVVLEAVATFKAPVGRVESVNLCGDVSATLAGCNKDVLHDGYCSDMNDAVRKAHMLPPTPDGWEVATASERLKERTCFFCDQPVEFVQRIGGTMRNWRCQMHTSPGGA